jgi:hypothetical protein
MPFIIPKITSSQAVFTHEELSAIRLALQRIDLYQEAQRVLREAGIALSRLHGLTLTPPSGFERADAERLLSALRNLTVPR